MTLFHSSALCNMMSKHGNCSPILNGFNSSPFNIEISGLKHILLAFSWEKRQAISCCHWKYFDFHTHFILCLHKCLFLSLIKIPMIFAKAYIDNCYYLVGKEGEDLLHEVASRYVEGMKDMEGRKPGPSSILGK